MQIRQTVDWDVLGKDDHALRKRCELNDLMSSPVFLQWSKFDLHLL